MQLTLTFLVAALATFATAASVPKPLKCAKGSYFGSQTNSKSYAASPARLDKVIGHFQESDWQGLTQTAKSGRDNKKGSTRSVAFGPLTLVEELLYFKKNSKGSETIFRLANAPLSPAEGLTITAYQEVVKASSKCNGKASHVDWTVDFCFESTAGEDATATVAGLFDSAHTGGLNNVTTLLHAEEFTSCSRC